MSGVQAMEGAVHNEIDNEHQKVMLIDDRAATIGTANNAAPSLSYSDPDNERFRPWQVRSPNPCFGFSPWRTTTRVCT